MDEDEDNYGSDASEEYEYQYSDDDDDEDGDGGSGDDNDSSQPMDVDSDGGAAASADDGDAASNASDESRGTKRSSSGKGDGSAEKRKSSGGGGRKRSGSGVHAAMMELVGDQDQSQSIRMLNSTDLIPIMKRRLKEVTEVLDVPPSAAAALMRENGWAKERLFETFYNDTDKLLKSCGVLARCRNQPKEDAKKPAATTRSTRSTRSSSKKHECGICYDEDGFSPSEMFSMPCGHEFCRDCWRGFLDVALTNGPVCIRQTCPEAGCKEIITEDEYQTLAPDLFPKFQTFQLRNFVECYGMTRWCPGPGCERVAVGSRQAADVMANGGYVAECDTCTTCFCLQCGDEPHAPTGCRDLAKWNEKCKNESETANWILANTKPCPKCSTRIEKNQGCNHMTCQSCKYEFCWICMGNWTDHGANTGGYYRCNKFDPNDDSADQSDAAKAKRELDRYLHYYKRYHAHAEAEKFAKRQLKETEARMVLLQEQSDNSLWTDVEFLKAANVQLVECRRVLKYTYAFAYYMPIDKNDAGAKARKERFEYHQEMLERFTENLSEISEKPLAEMDRTDVVNQTRVVDRFMKNVLKYVDEGLEE